MRNNEPKYQTRPIVVFQYEPTQDFSFLTDIITSSGYKVNIVSRDQFKLDKIVNLNPGLVLIDLVSGQKEGNNILQKLKENSFFDNIPILGVSNITDLDSPELNYLQSIVDWIVLPAREKEVVFRIQKYFFQSDVETAKVVTSTVDAISLDEARLESLLAINEYQAESIQNLLDFALNKVIVLTGSKIGYIYFYDEEKKEFTLNTWSKEVMDECKIIEPLSTYRLDETGIWGEVVRQRKTVVINDFQAPNKLKKGYPEGHVLLTRFLSIPVFEGNQIVAVVGVGNKEDEYNHSDIRQLSLMMNSVWATVRKKKQESQLSESEKRFRIMFESAPLSYQSLDKNACLIDVNQKWLDTLGYKREEVIGRPFGDFMTPESAQLIKNRFTYFVKTGEIHDYVFDMVRKDGSIITVSYDGNIGYDELGNFRQTHCIFSDISEKKRVEHILRENEERFRTTLFSIGDGVITTDAQGFILMMNSIAEQLTGWSQAEAEGKLLEEVFQIVNEDTRLPVEIPVRAVLRDGAIVGLANHTVLISKDKTERPIADNAAPIKNEKNEITGVVLVFRDQTEERKAQKVLRASEDRFRRIVESSPIGKYLYQLNENNQLIFLRANPAADRILGIDHQALIGKAIYEAFPNLAETDIPDLYTRIAKGELGTQRFELNYSDNQIDGCFEMTAFQIDENTIAIDFVDISERKMAEQKLRESEEKYRYLFENNPQPMWIYDLETLAFLNVNEAATVKYGFSKEEFLSMTLKDIRPQDEIDRLIADVLATSNPYNIAGIWKHKKKNGELIDVEIISHLIEYEGKQARLVLSNEVTQRVQAEQALRESEENFRSYFENSPLGKSINGMDGYMKVNQAFCRMLGYSKEELEQLNVKGITHPDDLQLSEKMMESLISGEKKIIRFEKRYLHKNGNSIWIELVATLHHDSEGKSAYFIITVQDITERRELIEELISAKEKAQEADRLKSAFLATMSHELRTPLNAVIGFSSLIDEDMPIEQITSFAQMINSSGNKLLEIVEGILDLTMLESGEAKPKPEVFELAVLMDHIFELFKEERRKTGNPQIEIELIKRLDEKPLYIYTDKERLIKIFVQLCRNALKFTPSGKIEFGFMIQDDVINKTIKCYVKDTGIGIPADKQAFIFDRFRQVEDSYTRKYGGAGIGLTIARYKVELLGGKIWVDSEPGKGSTFYFTIPFVEKEKLSQSKTDQKPIRKEYAPFSNQTILVVEDDYLNFKYLEHLLKQSKLKALHARNGQEAINLCLTHRDISLVLMDIKLPNMNGLEATKIIKQSNPKLPIVALTAFAMTNDRENFIAEGCDEYLEKPVKRDKLSHYLKSSLNKTKCNGY